MLFSFGSLYDTLWLIAPSALNEASPQSGEKSLGEPENSLSLEIKTEED
jgi:hypothetical protein